MNILRIFMKIQTLNNDVYNNLEDINAPYKHDKQNKLIKKLYKRKLGSM